MNNKINNKMNNKVNNKLNSKVNNTAVTNNTTGSTAGIKSTYTSDTVILIIGILLFIFIIIYIYNTYKSLTSIPLSTVAYTPCPDYWDSLGNGKCQNINKLGSCSNGEGADVMDFSGDVFTNTNTGDYAKCKWSQACKASWSNIDRLC